MKHLCLDSKAEVVQVRKHEALEKAVVPAQWETGLLDETCQPEQSWKHLRPFVLGHMSDQLPGER